MRRTRLVNKILQQYWRRSRGVTLGAQGVILDAQDRALLIRHTYRPGWHFPGGGVEKDETALDALKRELTEEAGVALETEPALFGIYTNFDHFPGDHILVYIVRGWRQDAVPLPNREISAQGFFALDGLPADIHGPTRLRLLEILSGQPRSQTW